jgi:hypothetical protein
MTNARRCSRKMKIKPSRISARQAVRLPDADFSVEESEALLHAIFPNYPDITGMKPAPEIGMFLRTLRIEKKLETDQSERSLGA